MRRSAFSAIILAVIGANSTPADAAALDPSPQERDIYCRQYSDIISQLGIMRIAGMSDKAAIRNFFARPMSRSEVSMQRILNDLGRDAINKLMSNLYAETGMNMNKLRVLIDKAYLECNEGRMTFIDD